jgi:hypothetical protein
MTSGTIRLRSAKPRLHLSWPKLAPASKLLSGRAATSASKATRSRLWTLAYGHHKDRTPTHAYEATREAAMAAFAKCLAAGE